MNAIYIVQFDDYARVFLVTNVSYLVYQFVYICKLYYSYFCEL
jgi:hypothetical protein